MRSFDGKPLMDYWTGELGSWRNAPTKPKNAKAVRGVRAYEIVICKRGSVFWGYELAGCAHSATKHTSALQGHCHTLL